MSKSKKQTESNAGSALNEVTLGIHHCVTEIDMFVEVHQDHSITEQNNTLILSVSEQNIGIITQIISGLREHYPDYNISYLCGQGLRVDIK